MDIKLTHQFLAGSTPKQGFWAQHLLKDVYTLSHLEKNLQKIAFPENSSDLNGFNPLSDVLGDGWELFNELLLKTFCYVPEIDFSDITICPPGTIGIDMYGAGKTLRRKTEQSKYMGSGKEPWVNELKAGEDMRLERFLAQSQNVWGVDIDATDSMIVVTNAKGLHYFTEDELLFGKVTCIGRDIIEELVNDNIAFWRHARESIMQANPLIKF
jgi:hypothetical protein